jgi:hypothetical protein
MLLLLHGQLLGHARLQAAAQRAQRAHGARLGLPRGSQLSRQLLHLHILEQLISTWTFNAPLISAAGSQHPQQFYGSQER